MQNKIENIEILFHGNHLSDEGIALWADALIESCEQELPEQMKEHVEQCPDCKKEILDLLVILKEHAKSEILPEVDSKKKKTTFFNKGNTKALYRIAAIIILFISIAAAILFSTGTNADHKELFAEYFEPYPNIITTKGHTEDLLSTGMYFYNILKYDSALLFYNKILEEYPRKQEVLFYRGISLLSINNTDEAILSFTSVVSNHQSPFMNSAKWYLALANLKAENINKSKELLLIIAKEESYYSEKAVELLAQLE